MSPESSLMGRWGAEQTKVIAKALRSGKLPRDLSPFGLINGQVDLRGFTMPVPLAIEGSVLEDICFDQADLSDIRLQGCHLTNVSFGNTLLQGLRDMGNIYRKCSFHRTSFRGAFLGYEGSQYIDCLFEKAQFAKAGGVRAEFYGCRFSHCLLKGMDFSASSFENCRFEGKVHDVWFRGGYPFESDYRRFGPPKKNRMLNVDFSKAELHFLTISDDCDLSTVIMPEEGDYRKYGHWLERILELQRRCQDWYGTYKQQARAFCDVYVHRAPNQDWMILNCDDLRKDYGLAEGDRIIETLDAFVPEE